MSAMIAICFGKKSLDGIWNTRCVKCSIAGRNVMSLSGALKKVWIMCGSCTNVMYWLARLTVKTSPNCALAGGCVGGGGLWRRMLSSTLRLWVLRRFA
eukprot:235894-Chlamydomonas_euryale.AAC.3